MINLYNITHSCGFLIWSTLFGILWLYVISVNDVKIRYLPVVVIKLLPIIAVLAYCMSPDLKSTYTIAKIVSPDILHEQYYRVITGLFALTMLITSESDDIIILIANIISLCASIYYGYNYLVVGMSVDFSNTVLTSLVLSFFCWANWKALEDKLPY